MNDHASTVRDAVDSSVVDAHSRAAQAAERVLERWKRVGRPDLPQELDSEPRLLEDRSVFLDLVQTEYRELRKEWSDSTPSEYCRRFPSLEPGLLHSVYRLVEVEQCLGNHPDLFRLVEEVAWPSPGERFGQFFILEELGRGAIGRVYLCREEPLGGREVVVKAMRFANQEALTLGKLNHPNVVPVHSVGVETRTGLAWICMPFLGRHTLHHALTCDAKNRSPSIASSLHMPLGEESSGKGSWQQNKSGEEDVAKMFSQLADGLAYVHAKGLLHGDLKPSNILLADNGIAVLIDFNLAHDLRGDYGLVGGTIPYMAPEQLAAVASGEGNGHCRISLATEAFSFGSVLYQALTGRMPFPVGAKEESLQRIAQSQLEAQAAQRSEIAKELAQVDRRLRRVVLRCLTESPEERPVDFRQIRQDLRSLLTPKARFERFVRKRPGVIAGVALGLALVVGAAAVATPLFQRTWIMHRYESLRSEQRHDAAAELLHPYVDKHPHDLVARRRLATCFLEAGNPRRAAEHYMQAWREADDPLDVAMAGYCRNRLGEHAFASGLYEVAEKQGLVSAAVQNNLAASILSGLHKNFDHDACGRVERCLFKAYELAPTNETVRLTMLRYFLLLAARTDEAMPIFPVEIAQLPSNDASQEFCLCAVRFLVLRSSSPEELRRYGLPCLRQLVAYAGIEPLRGTVGAKYLQRFEAIPGYEALPRTPSKLVSPKPPEFLRPDTVLKK